MSTQTVVDYLTKQIFIEKNIVTYRSLSRELCIHVNAAKNELATYRDNAPYQSQVAFATYLVSGEIVPRQRAFEDIDMARDDDGEELDDAGEDVPQTTLVLVNERDFERVQFKFSRIHSIHVYSLAPSPINDAGLICAPTDNIRSVDFGNEAAKIPAIVGKIVGSDIKVPIGKNVKASAQSVAGPSKTKPFKVDAKEPTKEQPKIAAPKVQPVPAAQEEEKRNVISTKEAKAHTNFFFPKAKQMEASKPMVPLKVEDKGIDRHSTTDTRLETAKPKPETSKGGSKSKESPLASTTRLVPEKIKDARVKNRTIVSDNDDEDEPQPWPVVRSARAKRAADSDSDRDVKAMMDIDDDQVIHAKREVPTHKTMEKEEEEEEEEEVEPKKEAPEDIEMEDVITPVQKPKKRRPKRVVPVGKNGLKKKRVVKSRQTTDEKGYFIVEDYSSYESVDEEEEPEPPARKLKGKSKVTGPKNEEGGNESSTPAPKIKPENKNAGSNKKSTKLTRTGSSSRAGPAKQQKIANFFMSKQTN